MIQILKLKIAKGLQTNEFSKIVRHKVNIYKSVMYTVNKQLENKIQKNISCTVAPKNIKYLEITRKEDIKDLWTENYKSLLRAIKDLNKDIF